VHHGVEVLTVARVPSTHEEPGPNRPALPRYDPNPCMTRIRSVTPTRTPPSSSQQAGTVTSPASYSGHPGSTPGAATRNAGSVLLAAISRFDRVGLMRRSRFLRNCRLRVRAPPPATASGGAGVAQAVERQSCPRPLWFPGRPINPARCAGWGYFLERSL